MRYENRDFQSETLVLDGNDYINCTFTDCDLVYSALPGPGGQIEPFDVQGARLRFEGPALEAVKLQQKVMEAGISQSTPLGAYLRIGDAWFQRIAEPAGVGREAGKTDGLAVVIP